MKGSSVCTEISEATVTRVVGGGWGGGMATLRRVTNMNVIN